MTTGKAQAGPAEGAHLVLFDGVCGLCSRLVPFVIARDPKGLFRFAALQSSTGREAVLGAGRDPDDLATFSIFPNQGGPEPRELRKGEAALFLMKSLGWPWRAAGILGVLPASLLDRLYDLVARNRYRLFGRTTQCYLPRPEDRGRFVGEPDPEDRRSS